MEEIVDENKLPAARPVLGDHKFHFGAVATESPPVDRYSGMPPLEEIKKFEHNDKMTQKTRKNRAKTG